MSDEEFDEGEAPQTFTVTKPGVYGVEIASEVNALPGVEPKSVPVTYTPPKYGPPPGYSAEKWRAMSRARRREILRAMARSINRVAG